MAIPNKYKGKSFAEVAKNLQATYKDRHDPISLRGLNKDMSDLQEYQDYTKQKLELEQQTQAMLDNPQGMQQQEQPAQPQMQAPQMQRNSPQVNLPQEQQGTFQREASSDYNNKFDRGGPMDKIQGLGSNFGLSDQISMVDPSQVQGVNMSQNERSQNNIFGNMNMGAIGLGLQAAPILGNIAQLASLKRAPVEQARTIDTSGLTSAIDNFKPRENRFDKVDLNQIERGINEASGRFTQNNINASNGNAGAFASNELANQSNLYRAVGDARLKGQAQDQQTAQLNAADRARVDSMNLQKATASSSIGAQGEMFNAKMEAQNDMNNLQNTAAFEGQRANLWGDMFSNIAGIGTSMFNADRSQTMTGYGILGGFKGGQNAMGGKMNSYADGGMMGDCGGPGQPPCDSVIGDTRVRDNEGYLTAPKVDLYDGQDMAPRKIDNTVLNIERAADLPTMNAMQFEKFYTDIAVDEIKKADLYNNKISPEDNVVLHASFPNYEEYTKKYGDGSKTKSGMTPGNNSKKVYNDPFYRSIEKTRKAYGGKMSTKKK